MQAKQKLANLETARRRRERVKELVLQGSLTAEEFAELQELGRYAPCPICDFDFEVAKGIAGPHNRKYCSCSCKEKAERAEAPMIKPQTKGLRIDGWDL